MERMGISYSKYTNLRLLLLDRIHFPPEDSVRATTKDMRVDLDEYLCGVRAKIADLLQLTLTERLSVLKDEGIEISNNISFSFSYGADGSGKHKGKSQIM